MKKKPFLFFKVTQNAKIIKIIEYFIEHLFENLVWCNYIETESTPFYFKLTKMLK